MTTIRRRRITVASSIQTLFVFTVIVSPAQSIVPSSGCITKSNTGLFALYRQTLRYEIGQGRHRAMRDRLHATDCRKLSSFRSRLHFSHSHPDTFVKVRKPMKLFEKINGDDGRGSEVSLKLKNNKNVVLEMKDTEEKSMQNITEETGFLTEETEEDANEEKNVVETTVGQVCVIPDSMDYESPKDHVRTSLYYHLDESEDPSIIIKDGTGIKSMNNDEEEEEDFPLLSMAKDAIKTIAISAGASEGMQRDTVDNSESKGKIVFQSDTSKISSNGSGNKNDYYKNISSDFDSKSVSARVTGVAPPQSNPTITLVDSYSTKAEQKRDAINRAIENVIIYLPIVAPFVAYNTFTNISWLFTQIIALLAQSRWAEVDGGLYSTKILTPAINGIVVPAVSILFATLVSSTVTTLRTRQLDIRTSLNKEANNLRTLQSMIDSFPTDTSEEAQKTTSKDSDFPFRTLSQYQDKCRDYLTQYVVRLIAESQDGANINTLEYTGSVDSEMNALVVQLNELSARQQFIQQRDASSSSTYNTRQSMQLLLPPALLNEAYGAVTKLNEDRSIRISALQSTFPMLHYVLIMLLGNAILIVFLIESADKPNLFLNEVQLQLLWTILIGTFSALGTVLYDLSDPFRGSYQISGSRRQLYTIRDSLKATTKLKQRQIAAQAELAEKERTPQQGGKI